MAAQLESEKLHPNAEAALNIFPLGLSPSINCLAAMRAQSPPKIRGESNARKAPSQEEEEDQAYSLWQVKRNSKNLCLVSQLRCCFVLLSQVIKYVQHKFSLQAEYPSAVENFDALEQLIGGRQVAVFLDYDGTLSPIVEDPSKAFMSEQV